jgi:DNA-binding transcriptional LysR family regulator
MTDCSLLSIHLSVMDIRHLVTFATVLRARTFLATARALGYSQSTVTLHIQTLEEELGVQLFDRIGKRVVLTQAGRHFETRSRQILDALEDLKRDMASRRAGRSGAVRFGSVEPAASGRLPKILASLCGTCPGIEVYLQVAGSGTIARSVANGELDFGIATVPDGIPSLSFEPLFHEELVLAVPRKGSLAKRRFIRPRDIAETVVVLTEQGCAYRRVVQDAFSHHGLKLHVAHEMGSLSAVLSSVRAGLGIAVVPRSAVADNSFGVVVRSVANLKLRIAVGILSRAGIGNAPEVSQVLIDHIRKSIGQSDKAVRSQHRHLLVSAS